MGVLDATQAKKRDELLAKGLFDNSQNKVDQGSKKKPLSSQTSTNKPQTDRLSKAPEIPQVPSLSQQPKPVKAISSEIKPPISQRNIPSFVSAARGLPPNSPKPQTPPKTSAPPQTQTKNTPTSSPVAATPSSQSKQNPAAPVITAANNGGGKGKNTGIPHFGPPPTTT